MSKLVDGENPLDDDLSEVKMYRGAFLS